ncbi:MAG: DUF4350 domain-containing protein, partial [Planctomycetota bacterium]
MSSDSSSRADSTLRDSGALELSSFGQEIRRARLRTVYWLIGATIISTAIAFLSSSVFVDTSPTVATSKSARANGFLGALRVFRDLGFRVSRHRRSYGQLPPPEDSVLLILAPIRVSENVGAATRFVSAQQRRALTDWVDRGGRVVYSLAGRDALVATISERVKQLDIDVRTLDFLSTPETQWVPFTPTVLSHGEVGERVFQWRMPDRGQQLKLIEHLKRVDGDLPQISSFVSNEIEG